MKPNDDITLVRLGRFHRTPIDVTTQEREILVERLERKEKKMGFTLVKRSELPVATKGKEAATAPKITISEGGQVTFNSFINKSWVGVTRIAVLFDPEAHKILFAGLKDGEKLPLKGYDDREAFTPTVSKADEKGKGGGDYRLSLSSFLKIAKYDYSEAGNQVYDTVTYNEKLKGYVLTLPATTPAKRPVTPRKPKAEKVVAAVAPNGAIATPKTPTVPAPVVEAPAEELILD